MIRMLVEFRRSFSVLRARRHTPLQVGVQLLATNTATTPTINQLISSTHPIPGLTPASVSYPINGVTRGMRGMCGAWGQTEFQVNLKLGLTLRQVARERRIISKCETFHRNPAGNQPRPAEPGQQPEASLAWWVGDRPCEA